MFPLILRIGPMTITQFIFLGIGATSLALTGIWSCHGFTFIHLSAQLFLIQIILVLRLIKKNKELRVNYISKLVFGTQSNFLVKMIWNMLNIWGIIIGLGFWMIKQGVTLANNQLTNSQKVYTLYPLCYFSALENHLEQSLYFNIVMNFLYAFIIFVNVILISFSLREFYLYQQNIKINRQYIKENNIQDSQSLIDCLIIENKLQKNQYKRENFNISENSSKQSNQNDQNQIECGICLRKLNINEQKIIKLRCSHYFHKECISLWLKVKDCCPYRCI